MREWAASAPGRRAAGAERVTLGEAQRYGGPRPGGAGSGGDPERIRKLRDRVRENFDRGAGAYQGFEAASSFFRGLLDELLAAGPSLDGARVLDVGCGTGASLARLTERVGARGRACGLDLSLPMLGQARRLLGPGAGLVCLDGCEYGSAFRAGFDAVVYNAVLFLLPDARRSLASAREVLAPGGWVHVSNLEGVYWEPGRSVAEVLAARGLPTGRHALSPWPAVAEGLAELFEPAQLRRWSVALEPARFRAFYGLEPMSAGLLPGLPYPERREAVEALAREAESQGRSLEQVWILASARKPVAAGGLGREPHPRGRTP